MNRRASGIEGLAKEGDASLGPETFAEEDGRVHGGRQDRAGHRLGHVVQGRELRRIDLKVDLTTAVARLQHHRIVFDLEFVTPLELELVRAPTHPRQRLVQRMIPRHRSDVVEREVGFTERREDPRENHVGAKLARSPTDHAQEFLDAHLERAKATPPQHHGLDIHFEVEARQLRRKHFSVEPIENLHGDRSGAPSLVDQEHFLLATKAPHTGLDQALFQHLLEGLKVLEKCLREGSDRAFLHLESDCLTRHSMKVAISCNDFLRSAGTVASGAG